MLCMPFTTLFAQQSKPNIIVILVDDLGWGDLGYNGSTIRTPAIDQLSTEGIRLNRFYTAAVCTPTRGGLMTGRYPERYGLRKTVIPPWSKFGVSTNEVFLPEYLEKAGYKNRTILGKWHLGHSALKYHPLRRGFTHFYGHLNGGVDYFTHIRAKELDWHNDFNASYDKGYTTDLLADEAVKNITDYSQQGPFFMYLAFNAPHGPFQAKDEDLLEYANEPNTNKRTYAAMVSNLDKNVGKVLQRLKTLNIEDNTIVLFFSDNGYAPSSAGSAGPLRGSKFTEWEGGVRSPAIIKWPGKFRAGQVMEQVTGYIDVLPTLLDIAGITETPKNPLDGISIYPVLTENSPSIIRDFYLGNGALVNVNWKFIEAGHNLDRMNLQNDVLFNISQDMSETTDVSATRPANYNSLKNKLLAYKAITSPEEVLDYDVGQQGFVAPKEWKITESAYNVEHTSINIGDPTILNHEGNYYLYGTQSNEQTKDGFMVYNSTDLKNWNGTAGLKNGYALKKDDVFGDTAFRSPQVFHLDNKFYMAYTANENISLAESNSPLGPFTQQIKASLFSSGKNTDPFIFLDDDGKKYLYYSAVSGVENRIFVVEMENDLAAIRPQTMIECIRATATWEKNQGLITNGPTVVKQNGLYIMLYSANHYSNTNYAVGYATSTSPTGPWTKYSGNPILRKENAGINGTGHGDLFQGINGDWKFVFHTHYSNGKVDSLQSALANVKFNNTGQRVVIDAANHYHLKRTIYFKQDFNSSTTRTDYLGSGGNQFDGLSFNGTGSVNTLNNKLRIIKNGGTGNNRAGAAKTDNPFNHGGSNGFIRFAMDVSVSNNTVNVPKGFRFSVGSLMCCQTPGEPNKDNIHSDLYINPTAVQGTFILQGGPDTATISSQSLSGTQKLVWYINRTGKKVGYMAPNGMSVNVANNAADVWAIDQQGTATLVLDEAPATTPDVSGLRTFKISSDPNFVATLEIDNMIISEEPQIAVTDLGQQVNYGRVSVFDFDGDGDLDLIVGGGSGGVGSVQAFTNNGGGLFTPVVSSLSAFIRPTFDWNDIDQDGQPDIIQNGFGPAQTTKLFNTNGSGVFTESAVNLPQTAPTCGFADFNNDGYLDIFVFGNGTGSKILLNNGGNGFTESTQFGNYHFINPAVSVIDYDNDNDLDLFVTATVNGQSYSKLFVNNNGIFTETTINGLLPKGNGSSTWGDYDGDGLPDLLLNGDGTAASGEENNNYRLYKNHGNGTFTEVKTFNYRQNFTMGGGRFLDWDNDGDLDIVVTGLNTEQNRQATDVYINSNGTFISYDDNKTIPGVSEGSVELGDIDNDGDLDLLVAGFSANNWDGLGGVNKHAAFVVLNPNNQPNTAPDIPTNLTVTGSPSLLAFNWTAPNDNTTPKASLTYNFFLVDSHGKWYYYPASDTTSGKTKIARIGNVQYNKGWIVKGLPAGTYRWGVQALDNSYSGSLFAKGSFIIDGDEVLPVTLSAFNVTAESNNVLIKWMSSSEVNVAKYIVEHSDKSSVFKEIAAVGARNNNTVNEYSVRHYNPSNGINYYRLTSIDKDAKAQTFDILPLKYQLFNPTFSLYPNPIKTNTFNLQLVGYQEEITVRIIDVLGRVVATQMIRTDIDIHTYQINLGKKLDKGVYQVNLKGQTINKKASLLVE